MPAGSACPPSSYPLLCSSIALITLLASCVHSLAIKLVAPRSVPPLRSRHPHSSLLPFGQVVIAVVIVVTSIITEEFVARVRDYPSFIRPSPLPYRIHLASKSWYSDSQYFFDVVKCSLGFRPLPVQVALRRWLGLVAFDWQQSYSGGWYCQWRTWDISDLYWYWKGLLPQCSDWRHWQLSDLLELGRSYLRRPLGWLIACVLVFSVS